MTRPLFVGKVNQLLAMFQCLSRHIEPGPLNTFNGWGHCGRTITRGQKALTLCLPIQIKKQRTALMPADIPIADGAERMPEQIIVTRFVYKSRWFVLSQTEGDEYVPTDLPAWNERQALSSLLIERISFMHTDGNVQGYARQREVAVSPIADQPHRTLFHELAHVILGHTAELAGLRDGDETTARDIREVEAECVALICCQSLDLRGDEFSRGYIQHWLSGNTIADRAVQRIFKAADAILKAGRAPVQSMTESES